MNPLKKILARVRNAYDFRHEPERLRPLTILFWRSVLLGALLGGVLILGGGVWQFFSVITALNDTDTGVSTPAPVLDRAELREFLRVYDERAATFDARRR